jgi:hypothetical protein
LGVFLVLFFCLFVFFCFVLFFLFCFVFFCFFFVFFFKSPLQWLRMRVAHSLVFLCNVLSGRGSAAPGPTVATVGLQMQIPIAMVADFVYKRPAWLNSASTAVLMVAGTSAILAGFLGVNLSPSGGSEAAHREEGPPKPSREAGGSDVVDHANHSPRYRVAIPAVP